MRCGENESSSTSSSVLDFCSYDENRNRATSAEVFLKADAEMVAALFVVFDSDEVSEGTRTVAAAVYARLMCNNCSKLNASVVEFNWSRSPYAYLLDIVLAFSCYTFTNVSYNPLDVVVFVTFVRSFVTIMTLQKQSIPFNSRRNNHIVFVGTIYVYLYIPIRVIFVCI